MINVTILPATDSEMASSSTHAYYGASCTGFNSILTDKKSGLSYHFDFPEESFHCNANNFINATANFALGKVSCGSRGQGLNPNNFANVYIESIGEYLPLKF